MAVLIILAKNIDILKTMDLPRINTEKYDLMLF